MLDTQAEQDLGIRKNNWYLFTAWKKAFKKANKKLLKGKSPTERKKIYTKALIREGIIC